MNLEKLGLLLFLKMAQDQQKIKQHLKNSAAEMTKACLQGFKILQAATVESGVIKTDTAAAKIVSQFDALADDLLKRFETQPASKKTAKTVIARQIVGEILQVLDEEKEACQISSDAQKSLKIGHLEAIGQVLRQRFFDETSETLTRNPASKKQVQNG